MRHVTLGANTQARLEQTPRPRKASSPRTPGWGQCGSTAPPEEAGMRRFAAAGRPFAAAWRYVQLRIIVTSLGGALPACVAFSAVRNSTSEYCFSALLT